MKFEDQSSLRYLHASFKLSLSIYIGKRRVHCFCDGGTTKHEIIFRKWLFALTKVQIASSLFALAGVEVNTTLRRFLIYPHKKTLLTIKYELTCQQTGKKSENGKKRAHPRTPPPRKNFSYYCDTTFLWVSTECA